MAYEQKPGDGAIFKNESENEKAPQYKGYVLTPEGQRLELALWVRKSEKGVSFFSVKAEYQKAKEQPTTSNPAAAQTDDLPF